MTWNAAWCETHRILHSQLQFKIERRRTSQIQFSSSSLKTPEAKKTDRIVFKINKQFLSKICVLNWHLFLGTKITSKPTARVFCCETFQNFFCYVYLHTKVDLFDFSINIMYCVFFYPWDKEQNKNITQIYKSHVNWKGNYKNSL